MTRKQIDNVSKYCYDVSKLMIGLPVVGNMLSGKFSWKVLATGLVAAFGFFIIGYLLDKKEVNKDDAN